MRFVTLTTIAVTVLVFASHNASALPVNSIKEIAGSRQGLSSFSKRQEVSGGGGGGGGGGIGGSASLGGMLGAGTGAGAGIGISGEAGAGLGAGSGYGMDFSYTPNFSKMDALISVVKRNQFSNFERDKDQCLYKLTCLVVCVNWYRPVQEALYRDITFYENSTFRSFLRTITHFNTELHLPAGHCVKRVSFRNEQDDDLESNVRSLTFTEFELLALYCPYLVELDFRHPRYWQYLDEIEDLPYIWPRLSRLPTFYGDKAAAIVYKSMSDRVTSIEVADYTFRHVKTGQHLVDFLSPMPKLESIKVENSMLSLHHKHIEQIHIHNTNIHHLSLLTRIKGHKEHQLVKQGSPIRHLRTLHCIIDDPYSIWFHFIRHRYIDIQKVEFKVLKGNYYSKQERQREEIDIAEALFSLFKENNAIRQLSASFSDIDQVFMEYYIIDAYLLNADDDKRTTLSFDFACFEIDNNIQSTVNSLRSTTRIGYDKDIHHHFDIKYGIGDENEYDMLAMLKTITSSIHTNITELTLQRLYFMKPVGYNNRTEFYIDTILNHFLHLVRLSYVFEMEEELDYCPIALEDEEEAVDDVKPYYSLTHFAISNGILTSNVFYYVFERCPNLLHLSLFNTIYDTNDAYLVSCIKAFRN
ncbi:hypothetical protein K501DRAFT_332843 [Backusella circina FSU 941]|nr:hypothetical protein K501DRAFT_332843 [Backusella circina FSU 941]